jgi:DNA-binding MurR/RpiR family transcriptional regulator
MADRTDKEMERVRAQIAELIKEDMMVMSLRYTAAQVAAMVGTSKSTAAKLLRKFGLETDGYVWFLRGKK